MKTKFLKDATKGAVAAALFATSGLAMADPIWAGHFEAAYNGEGQKTGESTRDGSASTQLPIWAGHFEEAYLPPTERSAFASYVTVSEVTAEVVTGPQVKSMTDHLLWKSEYPL